MPELEQRKVLEYGYKIKVPIADRDPPGVDRPEGIPSIENNIGA